MSTNAKSNQMPTFNATLKSATHHDDVAEKNSETRSTPNDKNFSRPMYSARRIVSSQNTPDVITQMKVFSKKLDAAIDKVFEKAMCFSKKLARAISRVVRAYLILLLICVLITIGYGYLFNLVETTPAIVKNVPAIGSLLSSAKILVDYISQFLKMNVDGAIEYIEALIAELNY